jgi:hypothetical protein
MTRALFFLLLLSAVASADATFKDEIQPMLEDYCFDCHGDGSSKGDFSMEEYEQLGPHLDDVDHWLAVWRNLRAQIMPPPEKFQPTLEERRDLLRWIERRVFKLDPENPDPGRVTIRRLNRTEYRYAITDLLGVDYDTTANFPADDTGYGFDTIGDVLSISPLHLEKYLEAALTIVETALPPDAEAQMPERIFGGREFHWKGQKDRQAARLTFPGDGKAVLTAAIPAEGTYEVSLRFNAGGTSSPGQKNRLELWAGGLKVAERTIGEERR